MDCFRQKLRVLDSKSSSFKYKLYLYLYNLYSKQELCESNTLTFWQKQSISGIPQVT